MAEGRRVLRAVELWGALSLACDLGTGQVQGHGLRVGVLAARIGEHLGWGAAAVAEVLQVALLRLLGCTADSSETAVMAGGDDLAFRAGMATVLSGTGPEMVRRLVGAVGATASLPRRAGLIAAALSDPGGARRSLSAHCEVAAMLADRVGVTPAVREALAHGYERWDGKGFPQGLAGDAVPAPVRVAAVARDAELWWRHDPHQAQQVLQARRGGAYDPVVVDACLQVAPAVFAELDRTDAWEAALACDRGGAVLTGQRLDRALSAVADFADLKSRWTRGHSRRVAALAAAGAEALGLAPAEVELVRRAGLVHDLGRVGVPSGIWDRPGPLGPLEWTRVRMHPYLTEVTLALSPALNEIARVAGAHHERVDGSGYHRGHCDLDLARRLIAAADVIAALGEDRPHRPAGDARAAADGARAEARAGRLDRTAVDAVLANPGHGRCGRSRGPAGLTERELQVLVAIARGRAVKQVAAQLSLSPKTVGRHVENIYRKAGVRSRAAAAVFAMHHRLLD